MVKVISSAISL